MKTEQLDQVRDVFNCSTFHQFKKLMDLAQIDLDKPNSENLDRFKQGKFDALFLTKPEFLDFSYLCGWFWQIDRISESNAIAQKTAEMFGEF